jgi:hypothetical protein
MSSPLPGHPEGPEYLGGDLGPGKKSRSSGRTGVLAAVSVAVVAVLGVGGWGVAQLMAGGSSPASALPATAVGYLSIDLDPSASQKIEAIKILKKFPALDKQLDLGSRDDLRRWVFEQIQKDSGCTDVDYAKDIEPWIGERIAVAAVPEGKSAVPVLAVQAGDQDAARTAVRKLAACGDGADRSGTAFVGDYLLVSDTQQHADAAAKSAEQAPLADDATFQTWMKRVGDPGVITAYASADAPAQMAKLQHESPMMLQEAPAFGSAPDVKRLSSLYKDFQGMAAVVRFHDGALETELVTKGLPAGMGAQGRTGPAVGTLPATTAAAFSVGFQDGWLHDYLDSMNQALGDGESLDQLFRQGEAMTGLKLPQDIETLLGQGISVSVDSSLDLKVLAGSPDPSTVPVGLRIKGDPAKITAVIDKLKAMAGPSAEVVHVAKGDGMVVLGTDRSYVDELLTDGGLGSTASFDEVVPEADRAGAVLYVDFDAGHGWAEKLGDLASDDDPQVRENIAPLEALGISSWQDGDAVQHGLVRLTTN